MKYTTIALILITLCACGKTYLEAQTVVASMKLTVQDDSGDPIQGAKFVQYRQAFSGPYPTKDTATEIRFSGANGKLSISANTREILQRRTLHGQNYFQWRLCLEKEGFITVLTSHFNRVEMFDRAIMVPGTSVPCPLTVDGFDAFETWSWCGYHEKTAFESLSAQDHEITHSKPPDVIDKALNKYIASCLKRPKFSYQDWRGYAEMSHFLVAGGSASIGDSD